MARRAFCLLPPLLFLLLLVAALEASRVLSTSATVAGCTAMPEDTGDTLRIMNAFSPCSPLHSSVARTYSPTWETFLSEQHSRDDSRLLYLASLAATPGRSFVPVASGRQLIQNPTYVVRARVGTPPQNLLVAVDTSNDAAWFPCAGCSGCATDTAFFTPSRSSTFRSVPCGSPLCSQIPGSTCPATPPQSCGFSMTYAASSLQAAVSQDTLSLAADTVTPYTFGCLQKVTGSSIPPQGLLGLGRGPLSFLSQTKDLYSETFSYCLPSYKSLNFSGTLRLGTKGQPKSIKTTPLLSNPRRSSLYYVNMTGIKVGSKLLPIPPSALAFDASTGAGTVIDSGTMFTRLTAPAYLAVRDEFRKRVGTTAGPVTSLGGFDTCYGTSFVPPTVSFVFDGMEVTLQEENAVIHSTYGTTACLAMAAAPDGVNTVLNVIATMQQQNHRVLFDGPNRLVGFARETCTAI